MPGLTKSSDDHIVRYATGGTDLGKLENKKERWGDVWPLFIRFRKGDTTLAQYRDMNTTQQGRAKSAPGFFIGCTFRGKERKRDQIISHQFITLDIDEGTPAILRGFQQNEFFPDLEHVVHSTRSHGGGKIKLHVIMPLAAPVDADRWHALARVLAQRVDPKMMAIDIVSYRPAQVMYLPSTNSDVKGFAIHHAGAIASAEGVFAEYDGDWRDIGSLPRSEREDRVGLTQLEAENPLEKKGIVGAWCRTHDIHDVIEMLDPPKYEVSERDADGTPKRYSFIGGHGVNGAVVYQHNGIATKLHSHHGTDPVSGQVNAWDLYRIHQFGDLDDWRESRKDDPREMKSYKAMANMIASEDWCAEVRKDAFEDRYGIDEDKVGDGFDTEDDYEPGDGIGLTTTGATIPPLFPSARIDMRPVDDGLGGAVPGPGGTPDAPPDLGAISTRRRPAAPPLPTEAPDGKDWREGLALTEALTVRKGLHNVVQILRNSQTTRGRLIYDEYAQAITVPFGFRSKRLGGVVAETYGSRSLLGDRHRAFLLDMLSSPAGGGMPGWSLEIAETTLNLALTRVADRNSYHPLKQWFLDLPRWDGTERVRKLFPATCGTPDDAYHRDAGYMLMTGAVARAHEPGCKFDYMVILQGDQGWFKSTFVRELAPWPELYGESDGHFEDQQKFVEGAMGRLFLEIGELVQFGRADVRAIKSMLSRMTDTARLAYRRDPQDFGRACVIIGTTNDKQYLRDETGSRRFWPIVLAHKVRLKWLERHHTQLWAEALHLYREMRAVKPFGDLPFFLSAEGEELVVTIHADKQVHDISDDDAARIEVGFLDLAVPKGTEVPGFEPDVSQGFKDDGLSVEMVLRQITCAQEIWDRCLSDGHQSYDERAQRRVGRAMSRLKNWTMHASNGPSCGRKYGRPKTYRREPS